MVLPQHRYSRIRSDNLSSDLMPSPASELVLSYQIIDRRVLFEYGIDSRFNGAIQVTYPFSLDDIDSGMMNPIALGVAVFVGQLCLARRIALDFATSNHMIDLIGPLASMLYDIRCWKDKRRLTAPPGFVMSRRIYTQAFCDEVDMARSCLLWSGGKDSTYSALLLRHNGYDVKAVHFSANAGVEEVEKQAVDLISQQIRLPVDIIDIDFPDFLTISSAYAVEWNSWPMYNAVPFGRDLLLALLACPIVRRHGASYLSMGHDSDCKTAVVTYRDKHIPRNDVESTEGAIALESYIRCHILSRVSLLPPVAGIGEYRVLHDLFTFHPDILRSVSFCFWGGNCGRCAKCLRYYLMQRLLGGPTPFQFEVNPLAHDNCPELADYVNSWSDPSLLFRDQVIYCLARLVQRGDVGSDERHLKHFERDVYPTVRGRLDGLEDRLLAVRRDPQVPQTFQYDWAACD